MSGDSVCEAYLSLQTMVNEEAMTQKNREEQQADARDAMAQLLDDGHSVDVGRGVVRVGDREYDPEFVLRVLEPVVGEARQARIAEVLGKRTLGVATVVEGLANVGNAAAAMRTAEAFGFQSFHVVTGSTPYKRSDRTTQGADKWLDVSVWDDPAHCVAELRDSGYQIVATCLDDRAVPIERIDFSRRTAIVFGNEVAGISDEMKELADELAIVEMPGFVESFNISVAAAVVLYHAFRERRRLFGPGGDLTAEEFELLRASFLARSTRHARRLLDEDYRSRSVG